MEGVIRIGQVQKIDTDARQVRVFFSDVEIMSGWLKVIKSPPIIPVVNEEYRTNAESGGTEEEAFAEHSHSISMSPWMPKIGDNVLCLYGTGFNGDGYVLGAI